MKQMTESNYEFKEKKGFILRMIPISLCLIVPLLAVYIIPLLAINGYIIIYSCITICLASAGFGVLSIAIFYKWTQKINP